MQRATLGVLPGILFGLAGCAHGTATEKPSDVQVALLRDASEGTPSERAAWLAYGLMRAKMYKDRQAEPHHNDSADDFVIELGARRLALEVWRDAGPSASSYFELLAEVERLGFLDEYVLAALARPGWTVPASALPQIDVPAFVSWAREHLQGHVAVTGAEVKVEGGKLHPDAPGETLPTFASLLRPGEKIPCHATRELQAATDAWQRVAASLEGAPLVARDRYDFLALLGQLKATSEFAARGVTWVVPRVWELHYAAGFCAVERQAWSEAEGALATAVALLPTVPITRLELANVYASQRNSAKARDILQATLDLTDDPCELARIWRKLGFVLIDERKLPEAYAAYRTSLDYEPGNPVALRELALVQELMGRVAAPGAAVQDLPALGHDRMTTSTCEAH